MSYQSPTPLYKLFKVRALPLAHPSAIILSYIASEIFQPCASFPVLLLYLMKLLSLSLIFSKSLCPFPRTPQQPNVLYCVFKLQNAPLKFYIYTDTLSPMSYVPFKPPLNSYMTLSPFPCLSKLLFPLLPSET